MKNEIPVRGPEETALRLVVPRHQRVLLDADLTRIDGVPTKRFNEQVKAGRRAGPDARADRPETLATGTNCRSQLISIPTGLGQTAAAFMLA